MTSKIYDQHGAAFRNVSAYVIAKDGKRVATVALKFGSAVTAYVHWIGLEMTKGQAGGGGYDRQSAAVAYAARKTIAAFDKHGAPEGIDPFDQTRAAFFKACERDGGQRWDDAVRDAGFSVFQAV